MDEPELAVQGDGGRVVGLDVQHAATGTVQTETGEPGDGEESTEPGLVPVRVDGDDVDLSHFATLVKLGPAEPDHGARGLITGDQETVGVEPLRLHTRLEVTHGPAAVL